MNSINQVSQKKIQTNKLLHYRIIFLLLNVIKVANVLCLSYIIASLAMKCKQLDTGPKQNKIQVLNKKCTCYKMALTRNECWSIGVWCFGAEIFPSCQEIACSLYMYIRYSYLFRLAHHKKIQSRLLRYIDGSFWNVWKHIIFIHNLRIFIKKKLKSGLANIAQSQDDLNTPPFFKYTVFLNKQ